MNTKQRNNLQQCVERARQIVAAYRAESPEGCDPQNSWAAVVVGGVSAATAAYGAYSKSQFEKDALDYQKNNTPQLKPYDPVFADYQPDAGISTWLDTAQKYGGVAQNEANRENNFYLQSLQAITPGIKQGMYLASKNANQALRGELPKDAAEQIARASAQAGLTGGFGAESGMGGNLTARDLGLESLSLRQRGLQDLSTVTRLGQALTPVTTAGLIGTPEQAAARYANTSNSTAPAPTRRQRTRREWKTRIARRITLPGWRGSAPTPSAPWPTWQPRAWEARPRSIRASRRAKAGSSMV
jgi:hypothetical protein